MLLVAAFIEAFWSSIAEVPAWGKFSVAGVLWAGRPRPPSRACGVGQLAAGQRAAVRGLQRAGLVAGCVRLGLAGDVVVQAAVRTRAVVRAVTRHLW
ncbi:hypothetical protein G6F22_021093 [Rhizopus arrhizus]|nr:hypothetical protein G6F22_021093 [Rhizopus arrhizus]